MKHTPPRKLYRWRITRIKASPAVMIGYVEAPARTRRRKWNVNLLR